MDTSLSKALHLINGDSAAGTLKMAFHLGFHNIIVNEDPIACGPTPYTTDLARWRKTREHFIAELYRDWPDFSFEAYTDRGLLMNAQKLKDPRSKILWVAAGVAEQLFVAWLIFLFDCIGENLATLQIAQFEFIREGKHVWHVRSMGELAPERIQKFAPTLRHFEDREIESYRQAWRTYTSDDPSDLVAYLDSEEHLPILLRAMQRLVYRYPSTNTGLSVCDEDLLKYAAEKGPKTVRIIGYTIGMNDSEDYLGDQYVFDRLLRLGAANLENPLVAFSGDTTSMRTCETQLTDFGRAVLSGEANAMETNGIDDWIGGVHLTGRHNIPVREGDSLHVPG